MLKKGRTAHYHLAWNMCKRNLSPGDISAVANKWLADIQEQVSGAPRIYIDNTVALFPVDKKAIEKIVIPKKETQTMGYVVAT